MLPILFSIGNIQVYSYGFFIAIGFLLGLFLVKKMSKINNLNPERMIDLSFWCLIIGFIGCRVLFIITRYDYFLKYPNEILEFWNGGFVFYGFIISGVPFGIWYVKKFKLNIYKVIDVMTFGLIVGHMFGRIGCFLSGCCHGKPTNIEWGIKSNSILIDKSLHQVFLHPVQLYESIALFIMLI